MMKTTMSRVSCKALHSGLLVERALVATVSRGVPTQSKSIFLKPQNAARRPLACKSSAAQQPSGSTSSRHAVLHDFCMVIPYGAASVAVGVVLFFLNLTNIAGTALVAGATSLAASVLSLKEWKAGGDSKTYTLISAGCGAAVAATTGTALEVLKGVPYRLSLGLCVLSVAAAVFCIYNVVAGGNPPPKKTPKAQ